MFMALYRKYRPLTFTDVVGQSHITTTLKNQLKSDRVSHAYIFTGTRGTGKTTCAKILSRAINCENPQNGDPCNICSSCLGILAESIMDVLEIDAASNNGVDNIRDVREETRYTPVNVKKRVYIIDEVHMLSTGAFNALLKTLEEPPAHVLFILATTEIHKVPATILSRCQRFDFKRIASHEIERKLLSVAQSENIDITQGAITKISHLCDGGMRDALSILDRVSADRSIIVDEDVVATSVGILTNNAVIKLCQSIIDYDTATAIMTLNELYREGRELSSVFEQILSVFRDLLLVKTGTTDVSQLISPFYSVEFLKEISDNIENSRLVHICDALLKSISAMSRATDKHVEADICMIRLCSKIDLTANAMPSIKNSTNAKPKSSETKAEPAPNIHVEAITKEKKPKPVKVEFSEEEWKRILKALTGKINIAALTNLKISSKLNINDDIATIVADDFITASLANDASVKLEIVKCINEVLDGTFKLNIIEQDKITEETFKKNNDAINKVLENAKKLDIKLEEI